MNLEKIKVIYVTNQACFHDIGFIDVFFNYYRNDFDFIYLTTEKEWDGQRVEMGYSVLRREYILCSKDLNDLELKDLFSGVDTLCIGSNNDSRIKKYYNLCKNVVFCTEHLSKKHSLRNLLSICKYFWNVKRYFGKKPKYLLSYSYYGVDDYAKFGFNKQNLFLFGYFPKLDIFNLSGIEEKNKYDVLWCGRLVNFKHIERALLGIKYLHDLDSNYNLTIIGDGPAKHKVLSFIKNHKANYINLFSFQGHESILKRMEKSALFLFTSDRGEGWGVVLNEAMSKGCICVCSSQAGSTNALQINDKTGLVFKNNRQFKAQLRRYDSMEKNAMVSMSLNAMERIKTWSSEEAGIRFGLFLREINSNVRPTVYSDGPISYKKP